MNTLNINHRTESADITRILTEEHGIGSFNNTAYQAFKRANSDLVSPTRLKPYLTSPAAGLHADSEPQETTDAMRFGSLVHAYVLQPETIGVTFVSEEKRVAAKKDGTPYADGRQDPAQKAEWEQKARQGIQVNSAAEHETAQALAASVIAAIKEYMGEETYEAEQTMWWNNTTEQLTHIGQADLVSEHTDTIIDVKTITDANLKDSTLVNQCFTYGYQIQAAAYDELYEITHGRHLRRFVFAFVSKTAPYHAKLLVLDEAQLQRCYGDYGTALLHYGKARTAQDQKLPVSTVLPPCTRSLYYNPTEE